MGFGRTDAKAILSQRRALNDALTGLLLPEIGQPGPQYAGDLVPGASQLQEQAFGAVAGLPGSAQAGARDDALMRLLSGEPSFTGDVFQQAIAAPTLQQFERDILPLINRSLAARGVANSEIRAKALGQAAADVNQQLLGARSTLEFNSRESALSRLLPAIEASLGTQIAPIQLAANVGATQRDIAGQQSADAYRKFLETQPLFSPALGLTPLLLNQPVPAPQSSSGGGFGGGFLGGLVGSFF